MRLSASEWDSRNDLKRPFILEITVLESSSTIVPAKVPPRAQVLAIVCVKERPDEMSANLEDVVRDGDMASSVAKESSDE